MESKFQGKNRQTLKNGVGVKGLKLTTPKTEVGMKFFSESKLSKFQGKK